jgi:hypothetical protein
VSVCEYLLSLFTLSISDLVNLTLKVFSFGKFLSMIPVLKDIIATKSFRLKN